MSSRHLLLAAGVGSAMGAAIFFAVLEWALDDERWGLVAVAAVAFGVFMGGWSTLLVRANAKLRTDRNVVFEHTLVQTAAVLATAWVMAPSVGHLRWQSLTWYTLAAVPMVALVAVLTRRQVKGKDPDEIFA